MGGSDVAGASWRGSAVGFGAGGSIVSFFFFQAEDGIRDKLVTGVQTCALPICPAPRRELALQDGAEAGVVDRADQAGDRDLLEQRALIRHPQTSCATCARSASLSDASGARTGPPYSPSATASIAAFTPAGPCLATISLSSGTSLSCSSPARGRSPARKAAKMSAQRRAAKHATARMPPSHSSSGRSEEHTSELQSLAYLVCRLLL